MRLKTLRLSSRWILPIAAVVLSHCSGIPAPVTPAEVPTPQESEKASPFSFDVVEEVNDGEQLHLLVKLRAATAWNTEHVFVRVQTFRAGEPGAVITYPVAQLMEIADARTHLSADEEVAFPLAVPAKDATDYQIEVAWDSVPSPEPAAVVVRGLKITTEQLPCGLNQRAQECAAKFVVTAELANIGLMPVETAVLGIGFAPQQQPGSALDLSKPIPENEEFVTLKNLGLGSGEAHEIRLTLDREIPLPMVPQIKPVVRLVSAE